MICNTNVAINTRRKLETITNSNRKSTKSTLVGRKQYGYKISIPIATTIRK